MLAPIDDDHMVEQNVRSHGFATFLWLSKLELVAGSLVTPYSYI